MLRESLHRIRLRLLALANRRRLDRDLEEELAFHLAMRAEQYRGEGLPPEQAETAAERRFGNVLGLKEVCRELWSLNRVEQVVQDLGYAARMLRKNPGFTAVAAATLGLGIGASTGVVAFLDLRPLPVFQPEQLVLLHWTAEADLGWGSQGGENLEGCEELHGARYEDCMVPFPIYRRVSEGARFFAGIAAFSNPTEVQVRGRAGEATLESVQFTTGNYFSVLGVGANRGRTLNPSDDREDAEPVAILSYRYWRDRFGGDPSVVGGTLRLNGTTVTLVGVAPETFHGLDATKAPAMWVPVHVAVRLAEGPLGGLHRILDERVRFLAAVGRLKPGVEVREAGAELQAGLVQVLPELGYELTGRPRVALTSASRGLNALQTSYGRSLRLLRGVVALVLVVACANIASLLLARASVRRREIAVRLALGAGRERVVAQLITEGALLSLLGTAGGLLLGMWSSRALAVVLVPGIETEAFAWSRPSGFVLAVAAGLSVFTTLVVGLVPAWVACRVAPARDLHPGGSGRDGARTVKMGRWIVGGEIAIALLLLIGAGLLVRTAINLVTFDPGFRTDHLLTVGLADVLDPNGRSNVGDHAGEVRDRLGAMPGVLSVTWSSDPLLGQRFRMGAVLRGEGASLRAEMVDRISVGPEFFETVGMPLLAGRQVARSDTQTGVAALWINRAFADRFPEQGSLGSAVRLAGESLPREVAGIVGNARYGYIQRPVNPTVYVPEAAEAHNLLLRTAVEPLSLAASARQAVSSVSPRLLVPSVRDERMFLAANTSQERLLVGVSLGLGGLVLLLAALGIYGVLSYSVVQRTSEIAIRMSLGALRTDVLRLVLGEGLRLVCVGALAGIVGAYWASRFLGAFLFEVTPLDPLTYLGATVLLVVVAAVAAYLPAARASGVDPLVALRSE